MGAALLIALGSLWAICVTLAIGLCRSAAIGDRALRD
jgi:hypothetical protein